MRTLSGLKNTERDPETEDWIPYVIWINPEQIPLLDEVCNLVGHTADVLIDNALNLYSPKLKEWLIGLHDDTRRKQNN